MKARNNIIDRNEVIWLSLIAVPIRIIVTFFNLRYERFLSGNVRLWWVWLDVIVYTLFFIFIYGIIMRKTAKLTVGYYKSESTDTKFPLIKTFSAYLVIGEVFNLLVCLIPYGITMLGRFTVYNVYNMYGLFYIKTINDFLVFIIFFIVCEFLLFSVLLFVFKICCNRYMHEDRKTVMAYDKFEYTVFSFAGRAIAFLLYYWVIKNNVENELTAYSVIISLLIPSLILRFYLKKRKDRLFESGDNKSIFKNVIKLILPGEILTFILGLTVFGIDYVYRFGKALAYPAYALFRFTYGIVSGRMGEINAGNTIFADYIAYIICYIVYISSFTLIIYLVARSSVKKKYKYA